MKILLDHCVPRTFRMSLSPPHEVETAAERRWGSLRNGQLLAAAAAAGFDALLTVDQNLSYQQNVPTLPLSVVVICGVRNDLPTLKTLAPLVLSALGRLSPRSLVIVP